MGLLYSTDTRVPMPQGNAYVTMGAVAQTAPFTGTDVMKVSGGSVTIAAEGFTTLAASLQRSSLDPAALPAGATLVWTNVGTALAANGVQTVNEAGIGWYRVNATTLTGSGNLTMTGKPAA